MSLRVLLGVGDHGSWLMWLPDDNSPLSRPTTYPLPHDGNQDLRV